MIFADIDDFSHQLCFDPVQARRVHNAMAVVRDVDVTRDWVALFDAMVQAGVPRIVPSGGVIRGGTIEFTEAEKNHRTDGPAIISRRGSHFWFRNGSRHRDGGPAVVWRHGHMEWMSEGSRHRIGGPAIVTPNGDEFYLVRGAYHRVDGPAVVQPSKCSPDWYVNGKLVTKEAQAWMSKHNIRRLPLSDEEAFVFYMHLT